MPALEQLRIVSAYSCALYGRTMGHALVKTLHRNRAKLFGCSPSILGPVLPRGAPNFDRVR